MNRRSMPLLTALLVILLVHPAAATAAGPPEVNVCWGYGCSEQATVRLNEADWRGIRAQFEPPPATAAAERNRVARAIARFEQAVGPLTGTSGNLGGSNFNGIDLPGQMDCIDESHNTTGYLRVLAEHGLLRWHEPAPAERRAPLFVNTHWSAVMTERESGERWAVDSWFLDNGSRPYIQRFDDWKRGRALPYNPDAEDREA